MKPHKVRFTDEAGKVWTDEIPDIWLAGQAQNGRGTFEAIEYWFYQKRLEREWNEAHK